MRNPLWKVCIGLLWLIAGCNGSDPGPVVCRPHGLQFGFDSTVYRYNDQKRIATVDYYSTGLRLKEDLFTYNSNGQLIKVEKEYINYDGTRATLAIHSITYDDIGLPTELDSESANGHVNTKFTHNDDGKLSLAETLAGNQNEFVVGSTRYEYDDRKNVTKVFYTIRMSGKFQEVLARENSSFDDKEKYYVNVPELKITNEYIYGYLPSKNNCLISNVIYYSYTQHFSSPVTVNFSVTYDESGVIKSLQNAVASDQYFSGDVLFTNATFSCF